jgi:hypothetical protein
LGSGWYLPSKDELHELYLNQGNIGGGFLNAGWWSSSESSANNAWYQMFSNDYHVGHAKYGYEGVRCTRSF